MTPDRIMNSGSDVDSRPVRQFALRAYWCAGASATLYRATILAKESLRRTNGQLVPPTSLVRPQSVQVVGLYYLSLLRCYLPQQPYLLIKLLAGPLRSAKNGKRQSSVYSSSIWISCQQMLQCSLLSDSRTSSKTYTPSKQQDVPQKN